MIEINKIKFPLSTKKVYFIELIYTNIIFYPLCRGYADISP